MKGGVFMKYRDLLSIAKKYPNCCSVDKLTRLSAEKNENIKTVTVKVNNKNKK